MTTTAPRRGRHAAPPTRRVTLPRVTLPRVSLPRMPRRAPRPHRSRWAWDRVVRVLATVLSASGLALVISWWAQGGGVSELAGWPSALASLGHFSALTSAFLLLVQVLLVARVPVLERAFGQDRLTGLHRRVGVISFLLMIAHVGLAITARARGVLGEIPTALGRLLAAEPGMLAAAAGTACLVLAVVTSVRWARRAVRYESWHLLHLYAYLGVGLALPHQLWAGREFLVSDARAVFWWALWGAAAASVLVWRVVLPLRQSLRHRLVVTSVVDEGDGCTSVYLTGRHLDELDARAGQFFSWRFLTGWGWTRGNPYSLSAAPDGRSLRITVKSQGDGSSRAPHLRRGTRVLVEGPFGRLTSRVRTRRQVALIGAGVGITPIRALAEELEGDPGDIVVLHRYTAAPLFARELATLASERSLRLVSLPGRRRAPDSWLGDGVGPPTDLEALRALVPDIAGREVYACGAEPWARSLYRTLVAAGTPAARIHMETFAW